MSKIIFILSGYNPDYSAVGLCVKNLIDVLEHSNEVIVISEKTLSSQINQLDCKSKVFFVESKLQKYKNILKQKIVGLNGIKKLAYLVALIFVKIIGYLKTHLSKINVNNDLVNKFTNKISTLIEKNDILIPVCLPFESILSSVNIKKKSPNIRVYPILFDKFSENINLHRNKLNYRIKRRVHLWLEKSILAQCNGIFYMDSWTNHIHNYHRELNKDMLYKLEHPLIKSPAIQNTNRFFDGDISVTYAGALYKKIRSPKYIVNLFSEVHSYNSNIKLDFYSKGDCNSYLSRKSKKNGSLNSHGEVTKKSADIAIMSSRVLLSIGNSDITQLPSKIFEYISTGKPIIHTFKDIKDPVIKILSKYRHVLLLDESSSIDDVLVKEVINFIINSKDVSFDEIKDEYIEATPKYVADQIMDVIRR